MRIFISLTLLSFISGAPPAEAVDLTKFQYTQVDGSVDDDDESTAFILLSYFSQNQFSAAIETARVNLDSRYMVRLKNFTPARARRFVGLLRNILHHRTLHQPTFQLGPGSWLGVTDLSDTDLYAALNLGASPDRELTAHVAPVYPDALLRDLCEHLIVAPQFN